ncbi:MAG: MFS transporter [Verrucomicrobia bacterium]|nr:MFS transporter [Verrucomicrobiota bacterium]
MHPPAPAQGFAGFLHKFCCLRSAPRELWIIYIAYVLENLAYKLGAASVLPLWLSSDLGFDDVKAGAMVAGWSAIMTLITLFIGSLTDALGIRRTFLLGFTVCLFSRIVMTTSVNRWIALPGGLYLQAIGLALMVPVMIAAVKRYSNAAQRSVAFSLYYALMNLGFAGGDWILDRVRAKPPVGLGEYGILVMPWIGAELSTYRVLLLLGVVFTVPGLLLVWGFLRDGVEMTEDGVVITPRVSAGLWGQPAFYRFLVFMTLVVGVRMIFFHLNYTFPKFAIRELGEGAPFARLTGMLNSLMIVVLVPICGVLTQKVTAYRMVTVGSFISALSVFFMALPPEWFAPLADGWLGNAIARSWLGVQGQVNPLYVSIFLFAVFLSIGEALWSPRLYEYSAAIAPRGQEASYMALSLLPYFIAKLFVGGSSGPLLSHFCPAEGPRNSGMIWVIVGGIAMITPIGAVLFRKHIQVHEDGRD